MASKAPLLYKDSPYTPHPNPCYNCLRVSCHALHSYSASECPYGICDECLELQTLDAQIAEAHTLLVDLSNKRRELKSKINRYHDPLTYYLPVEVISDIFTLISDEIGEYQYYHEGSGYSIRRSNRHAWNPALLLGAVCKGWREITLATPKLWTKVRIEVSLRSITDEWLSRSGSLPLSLDVYATVTRRRELSRWNVVTLTYSHTLREVGSLACAGRLKDLELRMPMELLRELFATLKDEVVLDSLSIQNTEGHLGESYSDDAFHFGREALVEAGNYSLIPKGLHVNSGVSLPLISFGWGSLAHLKATDMAVDSLIHVLHHAHSLEDCIMHLLRGNAEKYPVSSVTHTSLKELQVDIDGQGYDTGILLEYSTLPSLETLRYANLAYFADGRIVDALVGFLDRSRPTLREFSFYEFNNNKYGDDSREWYGLFPAITHLHLDIKEDRGGESIQSYIERLDANLRPLVLPSLQELTIRTDKINRCSWDGLAAMFPENEDRNDGCTASLSSTNSRPLEAVSIYLRHSWKYSNPENGFDVIPPATYSRLRAVHKSGVRLKVVRSDDTDVFEPDEPDDAETNSEGETDSDE